MLGGIDKKPKASVSGIAHITGGGLPGKVGRLLKPSGCGADLTDLFEPCNLMHYCQMLGKVPDDEAYKTWNMGQGMVITTPNPQDVINAAQKHGIEAKIVGLVTKEQGIRIISRGYFAKEKILNY
jgi:phosphoribosylformylglycinamidine cyclo-ligase